MPQTLGQCIVHIVFSTKNREELITAELEHDLFGYIVGTCRSIKCPVLAVNGVPDHVHLLIDQHRTISLSELVGKIKANSSRWAKTHPHGGSDFGWQRGYGYFGVGRTQIPDVRQYIEQQKIRHKRFGFQDEMRSVYGKMQIAFDERYVWD